MDVYGELLVQNFSIAPIQASPNQNVTVSFDLTNTGGIENGFAVTISAPDCIPYLYNYTIIMLQPGQTQHLKFTLNMPPTEYFELTKKDSCDLKLSISESRLKILEPLPTGNVTLPRPVPGFELVIAILGIVLVFLIKFRRKPQISNL